MKKAVRKKLKLLALAKRGETKRCIFCLSPNVTREHVFSQWTHKYMEPRRPGKANGLIQVYGTKGAERLAFKMPGQMRDWKIKCVCGGTDTTCNNGWMRKLDERIEPILSPLMRGDETRLSEADHKIVATWAILKVMVAHNWMVHHLQRKQMKEKRVPPSGWGVWIGNYDRKTWVEEWVSRPFSILSDAVLARRRSPETMSANSHATTQVFQKLFIHVVYCRNHRFVFGWRFSPPRVPTLSGHLVRIWPPIGHSTKWPRKFLTDADAAAVADAILNAVMTYTRNLGLAPSL